MGDGRLEWFCFFLLAVFHIEGSTAQCVQFTFPDLRVDSDVLIAAENTAISLKFAIRELTPGCWNNCRMFRVEVQKGDMLTLCCIMYSDGQFYPQQGLCTLTSEWSVFQFTYTVNRIDDKQKLRWRTFNTSVASEKYITFNITYPSVITTFALGGDAYTNVTEIPQGQQLSVYCAWHIGNPRSVGIIYRYHNNENKQELSRTADSATSLTHTISNAQCDDSGIYSCDVGDVRVDKTLLVQCPPTNLTAFTPFRFEEGSSAEFRFSVHSYTPNMTSCKLEAVSSSMPPTARNEDCQSSLTVTGSPPDLTVSVRLDSVRREDEGTWKLTLTNDMGQGETEFDLAVIEASESTTGTTQSVAVYIMGGTAAVLAVVLIGFGVVRLRNYIIMTRYARCPRAIELDFYSHLVQDLIGDANTRTQQAEDEDYHLIDDSHIDSDARDEETRPRLCGGHRRIRCRASLKPRIHHVPLPAIPAEDPQGVTSRRRWSLPVNYLHPTVCRRLSDNASDASSHSCESLPFNYIYPPSLPGTYIHPTCSPADRRPLSFPSDYLFPLAPPTADSNRLSALPSDCPHPVAPPTADSNRLSSLPSDYLHPVAPPTAD